MRLSLPEVHDLRRAELWSDLRSAEAEMERVGRNLRLFVKARGTRWASQRDDDRRLERVDVSANHRAGLRAALKAAGDELGRCLEALSE